MNKLLMILSLLLFCGCEKTIYVNGNESPHGGDDIQITFSKARNEAVKRLSSIRNCSFREDVSSDLKNWILQNSNALYKDIEDSEHVWERSENVPCGRTNGQQKGKILFSYSSCKNVKPEDAFQILVHESVHHLGITNEQQATRTAGEVFRASNGNCVPDINEITWLDAEIASWPATATINVHEVTPTGICYEFTSKQVWPEIDPFDAWNTIGNYWVVAYINDHWYATTYQWILPGHRCEQDTANSISEWTRHVEFYKPEVWKWIPQKGELVGFIVSSVRRFQISNGIEERTPVQWLRWPY